MIFTCPNCGEKQDQPDTVKEVWHRCSGKMRKFEGVDDGRTGVRQSNVQG